MAPSRRKGAASKAAAAAAARRQWKVGDLVLAKLKGFPAWPATVSEPEKWGYPADWKKILVYFFGTQQIAFCNPADVEPFTEVKKQTLLTKRQGRGADFVCAVQEIIDCYEKTKKQEKTGLDSTDDVDLANGGNSEQSSAHFGVKDQRETSETTILGTNDPDLNHQGDAPVAAQIGPLDHKDAFLEQHADAVVITEKPILTTYTSRKRSGGLRSRKRIMQEKSPSIERSRSSSRLESSRFQNLMMPPDDGNKSTGDVSVDCVRDRSLRSNRRMKKSPDDSEWDNADSSAFVSNGSNEENGSEIITADSDSFSLNEGSTLDSDCRLETSETAVQSLEGDIDLNKGLDFQIKAIVVKKKRKQNRKRATDEVAEPNPQLEAEEDAEVRVCDNSQNSQFTCENLNSRQNKDDGDEHLPLVKRARVRMGKPSSLEEEDNKFTQTEERISSEVACHAVEEDNSLSRSEGRTSNEVGVNKLEETSSSTTCSGDVPAHRDSFLVRRTFKYAPPLKNCHQIPANKSQLLKDKEIQSFSCAADGEAALPPSKRLHRALEAMSANAAEECQACLETSTMKTLPNGSSISSMRSSSKIVTESVESSGSEEQVADPPGNMVVAASSCGSKTTLEESNKSLSEVKICSESDSFKCEEPGKVVFLEAMDHGGGGEDLNGFCFETRNVCTSTQVQTPVNLAANLDRKQASLLNISGSPGQMLVLKDKCNSDGIESKDYRTEIDAKELLNSEHFGMGRTLISQADDAAKVPSQSGADVLRFGAEEVVCEDHERLRSQIDFESKSDGMCEAVKDVNGGQRQKEVSYVSHPDYHFDAKDGLSLSSPLPADRAECPAQISPPNTSVHVSTAESANFIQNSSSSSPCSLMQAKKTVHNLVADGDKIESTVSLRPKSAGKLNNSAEARVALSSFEAILGSLTRTKDSISRATRMAIDCAKFGVSTKVVEILARSLESETNLHRRVDLFFLVDSIAQCSRGLKGDVCGIYPSAIQTALPRLLSAAAPPGGFAHENRRQCLKVLRLWLERRILSESIIRHHMRELDSHGNRSSAGLYSRRSARTERALDDPVRDMEGMLVDEYGSNSSFQLPGFCMPRMLKDEDDGSDSDGGFEAVTPEHYSEAPEYQEITPSVEKHTHILEDVDGELEMEDVAPACDVEMSAPSGAGGNAAHNSHNQLEQHLQLPFAPPLPQDVPPTSPPLPSSPPPPPPAAPCSVAMPDPYANRVDSNIFTNSRNLQDDFRQSAAQHSVAPRINPTMSNTVHCHTSECIEQMQVRQCDSTSSLCSYPIRQGNNVRCTDGPSFHHKSYPPRPHHPPPLNQFSYIQPNQHVKSRRGIPPPSYYHRFHPSHNIDGGNFYNNHERMKPAPYERNDGWRFPGIPCPGPRYPDKMKASHAPVPYDGPPWEPTRFPHQEWAYNSREMHHRNFMASRPPPESAIPVANRAPIIWRPR